MRNPRTPRLLSALAVASLFALGVLFPVGRAGAADSTALLTWNKQLPDAAPPARWHAAMALDVATGTTVLFGGRSGNDVLADTWTWDGATWTAQHPAVSPPPLESASMTYESIGHRIILFGGMASDGSATSGTWAWDGTTWTSLVLATAPPARYAASIAADAVTGTDVLFGGLSAPGSTLGDTWSWDGTNWTPETPVSFPPARSAAAMTFDATRGVVVLFGGTTGSVNQGDTWTWDGKNWTQHSPAASPLARNDAALSFDAATQSAVLFGGTGGGNSALGDTWLWNGSTWSTSLPLSLLPILNPPARVGASLAAGPGNHRVVLFGGQSGGANPSLMADTWTVVTLVTASPPTTTPGSAGGSTTAAPGSTTSTTAAKLPTTTTPVSTPTTPGVPRAPLAVTSRSVHRGQQVTVSGSGFAPRTTVVITFHSAPVVVGTTTADAEGRFSTAVLVPTDIASGSHHIQAEGQAQSGGPAELVAQVSIMVPGSRHSWLLPAFMVAFTVLLAAGAGLVLTASTHWHSPAGGWLPKGWRPGD